MSKLKARQSDITSGETKLTPTSNLPIQAKILETPEGESYISQRIRPNTPFPLHSCFNAVRASVVNKSVKASRIMVTTLPFTAKVNWAARIHQWEMENESLKRFGIDVVEQSACWSLWWYSALY